MIFFPADDKLTQMFLFLNVIHFHTFLEELLDILDNALGDITDYIKIMLKNDFMED